MQLKLVENGEDALALVRAQTLAHKAGHTAALPKLKAPHALSECLIHQARDGAGSSFAWASTRCNGQERPLMLWVQDAVTALEAGRPYLPGLQQEPDLAARFVLIQAKTAVDMLWAMEEALLSGAVSAVIGEIWGIPKALNFTATKRLQRAAQIGKTPCFLLRYGQERAASGAHERWQVQSAPSKPHDDDPGAPGAPTWRLDLFKARTRQPSIWTVNYEREAHHLHLAAPLADGSVLKNAG
ncbi:MAG: hypothetical protein AAF221_02990 [Pseudomonadota bacterium]